MESLAPASRRQPGLNCLLGTRLMNPTQHLEGLILMSQLAVSTGSHGGMELCPLLSWTGLEPRRGEKGRARCEREKGSMSGGWLGT